MIPICLRHFWIYNDLCFQILLCSKQVRKVYISCVLYFLYYTKYLYLFLFHSTVFL
jgi:hypothetical protein